MNGHATIKIHRLRHLYIMQMKFWADIDDMKTIK